MRLSEIIAIADRVYPDGLVQAYFEAPEGQHGDTLAKFIAVELREVYDAEAGSEEQLSEAVRAMRRAKDELENVLAALEEKADCAA